MTARSLAAPSSSKLCSVVVELLFFYPTALLARQYTRPCMRLFVAGSSSRSWRLFYRMYLVDTEIGRPYVDRKCIVFVMLITVEQVQHQLFVAACERTRVPTTYM